MKEEKKEYSLLVRLGEDSKLKQDLNSRIASLSKAEKGCFRPHVCLNDFDGVEVIQKITQDPEHSNTGIYISEQLNYGNGDDLWLNVKFCVFLDSLSSGSRVVLSPQQTSYIITNLPSDSKQAVADKVRAWFLEKFMADVQKGLEKIAKQFAEGDVFVVGTRENMILDIHGDGGGHEDLEYTEWPIIGDKLFNVFFLGHTCLSHLDVIDGYERVDAILEQADRERKGTLSVVLGLVKTFNKIE